MGLKAGPMMIYIPDELRDRLEELASGMKGVSRSALVCAVLYRGLGMSVELGSLTSKYEYIRIRLDELNSDCGLGKQDNNVANDTD